MSLSFRVYGQALPKGSAKAFVIKGTNRAVVTSTTKGLKGWEAAIRQEALQHVTTLMEGPISLTVNFCLPRPKSLKKGDVPHIKRPDLDKLVRGATDALTGVIWKDDSQLTAIYASKFYAPAGFVVPFAEFFISEK